MAGTTGRPNPCYGWNAYDWCQDSKYSVSLFTALSFTGQTPTTGQTTVTMTGPGATGSKIGLFFGTGMGPGGYNRKTNLVAGPSAVIVLRELRPATVYNVAAYGVDNQGTTWVGPNALLTTT